MFDGKQFAADVVSEVRGHVERSMAPLLARMDALERRISELPAPKDGKNADPEEVAAIVATRMTSEIDHLRSMIDAIPLPALPDIPALVAEAVSAIEKPKDGHSPSPEEFLPLIEECVSRAVSAIPAPKDGKDGRDGCDAMDAMQDRDGNLIVTFADGRMKNVGPVCGKDGAPGKDGIDGAPGKDGTDGLGFEHMELVDTETGVFLCFARGDVKKEFRLPLVIDRGVFKEGTSYSRGDGVTWGGSFWIAQGDTTEKPDGSKGWRLAVKKGRDGRDGKDGTPPKVKV